MILTPEEAAKIRAALEALFKQCKVTEFDGTSMLPELVREIRARRVIAKEALDIFSKPEPRAMRSAEEWREEMKRRFVKGHLIDWECYKTIAAEIQTDALASFSKTSIQIDGIIRNACWFGEQISGQIYGDRKKRFMDGFYLRTSTVLENLGNNIFRTKNSTYKVEFHPGSEEKMPHVVK